MKFNHITVLKEKSIEGLKVKTGGVYFDGTLGGGGHSLEILKRGAGLVIATDLDTEAIEAAEENLREFKGKFKFFHSNFKEIKEILKDLGIDAIDGAILDLGVSSHQLDSRERGFSYMAEEIKLDMRMDKGSGLSAYDIVNGYPEEELKRILRDYGEERFAGNIARNIVLERADKPVETAGQLIRIIEKSIPKRFRPEGHIAKKSFQSLRIESNGELNGLDLAVSDIVSALKPGGRIAVITFHSLEDRIVKRKFRELETDCVCDKRLPVCVCGKRREIKLITGKPVTADEEELKKNSRAKSAKLRIAEKL